MARTVYDLSGNVLVADSFETTAGVSVGGDGVAIAALTAITTPNATDATTVITLANANKAKINAIIAALQA